MFKSKRGQINEDVLTPIKIKVDYLSLTSKVLSRSSMKTLPQKQEEGKEGNKIMDRL